MSSVLENYETAVQTAARLGIDGSVVRRYCEAGRIEGAEKVAGRWFIPKSAMPQRFSELGRPPTWSA